MTVALLRGVWRRPLGAAALCWLVVVVVASVAAPLLAPYNPNTQDLSHVLSGPTSSHWLGTGVLGLDELSRILYGGRVTLLGVLISDAIYVGIGVPLGIAAGYLGGWSERVVLRWADVVYAVPVIIILLVIMAVFPGNETAAMIGLGFLGAPGLARVVRSVTRGVREELYVRAARAAGLGPLTIMRRHMLPRVAGPLIVQVSLFSAGAVLLETGLGFLGLGKTGATWGGLVSEASQNLGTQPWLLVPSGFVIITFVLALGLMGDAVRDAFSELHGAAPSTLPARPPRSEPHRFELAERQPAPGGALLEVRGLDAAFPRGGREVTVVRGVDLEVAAGEAVGLVGESGCGKTVTALCVLGLLGGGGRVTGGEIRYRGKQLLGLSPAEMRRIRGGEIGWIAQDPMSSLDPCFTVGSQLAEAVRAHQDITGAAARKRAVELIDMVRLPGGEATAQLYPHQLSGGMAQRIAIAAALAGGPSLVIADEPTTALDVTVQAEILDLLRDLQSAGTAVVLVTHDWGVLSDLCTRAVVMYAGEVVEQALVEDILDNPKHPYTEALIAADPRRVAKSELLPAIEGTVPAPEEWPTGCHFFERCAYAEADCAEPDVPLLAVGPKRASRCRHIERIGRSTADSGPMAS